MALWKHDKTDETWDDGQTSKPGDPGFSRELAAEHFGHENFSYMGTPNWQPPVQHDAPVVDEAPAAGEEAQQ